jgi:hypothetical protein
MIMDVPFFAVRGSEGAGAGAANSAAGERGVAAAGRSRAADSAVRRRISRIPPHPPGVTAARSRRWATGNARRAARLWKTGVQRAHPPAIGEERSLNIRSVVIATLVAGTLDIGAAVLLTLAHHGSVAAMLQGIAVGPLGGGMKSLGLAGAAAGLLVHFGLMAAMVAAFALAADHAPTLAHRPLAAGAVYGVLLYLFMYWLVIPLRWGTETMTFSLNRTLIPIAIHIALVGWPIAFIIARGQLAQAVTEA